MVRGPSRDGLVQVGIERHAALIHPRHPGGFQLFPELALHQVHAVVDGLRVGLRRVDVREARQVIERVHQTQHEIGLRLLPRLGPLLERALAKIVVLRGQPEILVLEIRDLALQPGHRFLRWLDQGAGPLGRRSRIGAALGRLALLLFIVHGLAFL